jgi:hypothetical protein
VLQSIYIETGPLLSRFLKPITVNEPQKFIQNDGFSSPAIKVSVSCSLRMMPSGTPTVAVNEASSPNLD